MFENASFNVKEISSVALIKPKKSESGIIRYGDKVARNELVYKLSGEVTTHFAGKTFCIKPGDVYIIPKSENAGYCIERTVPGDCIDIFFDTDIPLSGDLLLVSFDENSKIQSLFQKIHSLWLTKPVGYYCGCMSALYEILYEMLFKHEQYSPKSKYRAIERGVEYLHANLYGKIDYKKPSELCGISYTYFKRLFIERFGVPPIRYVNDMRLERSRELLLTGKYSVSEIAEACGFENAYYFSRKFKEKYRFSPTQFINEVGTA